MVENESTHKNAPGPLRIDGLEWNGAASIQPSEWKSKQLGFGEKPISHLPMHGVCLWPEDGTDWIHPQDMEIALSLLPSKRVFRKIYCDDSVLGNIGYCEFTYGDQKFRGLPVLWREIETDGFEIGDTVELKSDNGRLRPLICYLAGMFWNQKRQRIEYSLSRNDLPLPNNYFASDFRLCMKIGQAPSPRQLELLSRSRDRI